ncbi:MAG TPA: hypothetical protein PLA90_14825 [Candidatus Sumerlaeota bacterium]|nr:hypothetical protein [Candidatus Sumerlaeota bacterium]
MTKSLGTKAIISVTLIGAVVAAVVVVFLNSKNTLDYRRGFHFEKKDPNDCFWVADKPIFSVAGRIYFLHPRSPRSDWQLMCFDCESWKLEVVCDFPEEFNETDATLSYVDNEEFWIIPHGMGGVAHSFCSMTRFSNQAKWYKNVSKQSLIMVDRFGQYAYCTIGLTVEEGFPRRATMVNRLDLMTGQIEQDCFRNALSGCEMISCGSLQVERISDNKQSLYFSAIYADDVTTHTQVFRLDTPDSVPVPVESYPPGRLAGPGNRFPFPVPSAENNSKDYHDLWVGTVPKWTSQDPGVLLAFFGNDIDVNTIEERKRLIRVPFSGELTSEPWFVSPDGKYVLYLQASPKPFQTEGLVAVNMETGKQLPILAHRTHAGYGFMDLHWQ